LLTESAVAADRTIAGIIQHPLAGRQRHRVVPISAHKRADTITGFFERLDMTMGEVVQSPPVGLRVGKAADRGVVHGPR
jgi:hypothetical protein